MLHNAVRIANRNAVLLVGLALVLCLLSAFVGVLQNAVQRGEMFRQQLSSGSDTGFNTAASQGNTAPGYGARLSLRQQALGASLAPAAMFAVQGSR